MPLTIIRDPEAFMLPKLPRCLLALLAALPLAAQPDSSGVKYGRVYVSGENPVIRLLPAAGATPTTDASFWRVVYSPVGMGHVLFLRSGIAPDNPSSPPTIRIAFTDNEKLAEYLGKEIMSAFNKAYADDPFPIRKATFTKSGNTLTEWKETVKSDQYTVELVWRDFAEPFQLDTPSGGKTNPYGITSFFIPARSADVIINGKKAEGRAFPTKRGRMENSTAFLAFSETWVR
ncbi:MAG: hypothetical protein ACHQQ3_08230 [Gemmatimonadales bacterium]